MNTITSAIVLCAGRGRRLQPHTDTTPKPLLPVSGRPTLDFIMDALRQAGIENVVLVTHHLAEQIESYAQTQTVFPVTSVACVKQTKLAGTADATTAALIAKPEWFRQSFLLTASDYLVPVAFYQSLIEEYNNSNKKIAVSLKRLPDEELSSRSSVRFNSTGDVVEVVEKPAAGKAPSNLSANLVYILPSDIAQMIAQVNPSKRGEKEIQSAINAYLSEYGPGCSLEQATPVEWQPEML